LEPPIPSHNVTDYPDTRTVSPIFGSIVLEAETSDASLNCSEAFGSAIENRCGNLRSKAQDHRETMDDEPRNSAGRTSLKGTSRGFQLAPRSADHADEQAETL